MVKTQFVAKALVLDAAGRFLLLTRSDTHPTLAGLLDLPGGGVAASEEPREAVARELHEEAGLVIASSDLQVVYAVTRLLDGISFPTLLYVARLNEAAPALTLGWEHSAYEWAPIDKLGGVEPHIAPTYAEALAYMREHDILSNI